MRVCWFGFYKADYSRNYILRQGLHEAGVEIVDCCSQEKGWRRYVDLIKQLRAVHGSYDVLYCAFPAAHALPIAFVFQSKPIVVDAFFPLYDAYVHDRKKSRPYSLKAVWFGMLDFMTLQLSRVAVVDTEQHKQYWQTLNRRARIEVVPLGVETDRFFPIETKKTDDRILVTFHGSYIPLQGIDKIVLAVERLKDDQSLCWRFIGNGQLFPAIEKLIQEKQLPIELIPWLSLEELNEKLNESDIVLGIFGDSAKTDRVVPNKVMQGIAVEKPVITKDTAAIREQFTDQELYLTSNDPVAIAAAISGLASDPGCRARFASAAKTRFDASYSSTHLGKQLQTILQSVV